MVLLRTTIRLILFFLLIAEAFAEQSVNVDIPNGPITGTSQTADGRRVWEFLGIPFAQPPVGSLRFRRPEPLTKTWTGPLLANKPPKGCLQSTSNLMYFPEHLLPTYGEDCLYLNIWTPTVESESKKSVMVWIHGGGFTAGESLPNYNGKVLASIGDVVVVSIHYRVGLMGFARFDSELVPGNNGLLDQQLALKWVHENIAALGGDPESVTIFGESAGGASVAYHLVNKESGRYFKRAIMQSGSFGDGGWSFNPNTEALEIANRQAVNKYLNCDQVATEDLLKCLESKTEEELKMMVAKITADHLLGLTVGPTLDGQFLSEAPYKSLASHDMNRKDLIIGLTEREGSMIFNIIASLQNLANNSSEPTETMVTKGFIEFAIDRLIAFYPSYPQKLSPVARQMVLSLSTSHVDPTDGIYNAIRLSEVIGQYYIECDVNRFADGYRSIHDNVYFYEMAHMPSQKILPVVPENWMKCSHGDDIPFIFGLSLVYPGIRNMTEDELLLSRRMIGDWTHFAKTGSPLDPNWRPFTREKKEFYRYKLKSSFETGGVKRDECAFWNEILPLVNSLACKTDSKSKCELTNLPTNEKVDSEAKDEL